MHKADNYYDCYNIINKLSRLDLDWEYMGNGYPLCVNLTDQISIFNHS